MIQIAVNQFWEIRDSQKLNSSDSTGRGAVLGGKQMDAYANLLSHIAIKCGVPQDCIFTRNNILPGFFRPTKDWDFIIISPQGKLVAAIEFKSQIGSYGNNFNNRTEEAIGSALDFWTAYRENSYPRQRNPFVGYILVVGKDEKSSSIVRCNETHYKVRSEFEETTYLDRYDILCDKLQNEKLYTAAAVIWTDCSRNWGNLNDDTSINSFIRIFKGHIENVKHYFK